MAFEKGLWLSVMYNKNYCANSDAGHNPQVHENFERQGEKERVNTRILKKRKLLPNP